ncbi:unnamed protein product, partial [marine sediment metagenome]
MSGFPPFPETLLKKKEKKDVSNRKICFVTGKECEQLDALYSLHNINKLIVSTLDIENVLKLIVDSVKE